MTLLRFLNYMGKLYGMTPKKADTRAKEMLDFVGLGRIALKLAGELSAGQRQRLGLAHALLNDPELLILDEPTSNLDPLGRIDFANKVKEISSEGKTVIISSHILPEISRVCNHVGIMSEGSLLVSGKISDLTANVVENEYAIIVSQPERFLEAMQSEASVSDCCIEDGLVVVKVRKGKLSEFWLSVPKVISNNSGMGLRSFTPVRSPLERVFLDALSFGRRRLLYHGAEA